MTNSDIEHMAQGYPPSHIGKDHEEVVIELATSVIELQQKLDALAAENDALMKFCKNAAFDADYESELGMEPGGFTDAVNDIKATATEAYLNSVRAEGVDLVKSHPSISIVSLTHICDQIAAGLRSGSHDTTDKEG